MRTSRRIFSSYLIALFLSFSACCSADIRFDFFPIIAKVNNKDYSIGAVRDIVKDEKGFIWIGGENGLARFDGQQVVVYNYDFDNNRSISSNFIWGMILDHDQVLWIATSNGLNRYNATTDDFDRFYTDSAQGLRVSDDNVNQLAIDTGNNLFIATSSGLSVFNAERNHIQNYYIHSKGYSGTNSNFIETLTVDKEDNIWIGTRSRGLKKFDLQTGIFHQVVGVPELAEVLNTGHISAIERDHENALWVGTFNLGVYVLYPDGQYQHFTHDEDDQHSIGSNVISDIFLDSKNNLWVAADHGGLNLFSREGNHFDRFTHNAYDTHSLGSNSPYEIYEDDKGNMWIGLFPFGVSFLNRSATLFANYQHKPSNPQSISNSSILSFFEDSQGTLWVGTENGLNSFDKRNGTFIRHVMKGEKNKNKNFSAVLSLNEDVNGDLLVGTWSNGLFRYNTKTQESRRYYPDNRDPESLNSPFVWRILRDRDNDLWIGTETGGLNRYVRETDSFEHYTADPNDPDSISSNQIWSVIEDPSGNIWVATQNGLDKLDKHSGKFKHYTYDPSIKNGISGKQILCLYADSQGFIWIGIRDAGLNILDTRTDTFKVLTTKQGLPSQTVFSVVEDHQNNMWVTTYNGVARINRESLAITSLDASLGYLTNTFNRDATYVDDQGRLYLGSIEGISILHPQAIQLERDPPPVVITDFRILNHRVPIGSASGERAILTRAITETDRITLDYSHTMFSFDFAALSYRGAENNSYAYMLENFDKGWNYVDNQRTATYTNILPGEYTFRVKAANNLGEWNEEGTRIHITIKPPLWRTTWAYILYALAVAALVHFVNKHKHLREISETYRTLSTTDPLTKIYNRAGIEQVADKIFSAQNNETRVGIMVIDLDHFKRINDSHGHDAGDRVLQEFSSCVNDIIRSDDDLGRWGGEEFILLSTSSNIDGVTNLAEKIRVTIQHRVFDADHAQIHMTVSIGVARSKRDESFEQVVKRADTALYKAKAAGRNTVVLAP
ncbi:putative diguanylate cyclase YedQ [Thalassocella blandensis]|nr:putative diguanylate cyclase YedQ [Thalassocella blandensis]